MPRIELQTTMFKLILEHPALFTPEYFSFARRYGFLREFFVKLQLSALCRSKRMPTKFRDAIRDKKLMRLLRLASRLSPWRDKIRNNAFASQGPLFQLRSLPVMTKDELRRTPIESRTDGGISSRFGVLNQTSGSTGEPIVFYTDKRLLVHNLASLFRIAGIEGISCKSVIHLWPSFNPNLFFENCFYAKTLEDLRAQRKAIYALVSDPKSIIYGFPSLIRFLSDMAEEDGVSLRPRLIIVAGETLTPGMRLFLQERFCCKIVNQYGCREISVMAGECESGRFHENSEDVIIEVVSEDGTLLKRGEVGKLVITGLNSLIAPVIRYQLGDRGFFYDDACPCGNTLPSFNFDGRTHDVEPIFLPDGVHISPYKLTGIFNRRFEKIRQYQINHWAPYSFMVYIVPTEKFNRDDESEILSDFKQVAKNCQVLLSCVASIESKGAKAVPYIKSF